MKRILTSMAVLASFMAGGASAQPLQGMCLDMREAGCMPRFLPFEGGSISFCEATCSLNNPVNVRGINAALYDLSCRADYDTPLDGSRVMILSQTDWYGRTAISWIDERTMYDIVPCP